MMKYDKRQKPEGKFYDTIGSIGPRQSHFHTKQWTNGDLMDWQTNNILTTLQEELHHHC